MELHQAVFDDLLDIQLIVTWERTRHDNVYAFSQRTLDRRTGVPVPNTETPMALHRRVCAVASLVPRAVSRVAVDNMYHDSKPLRYCTCYFTCVHTARSLYRKRRCASKNPQDTHAALD